MTSRDERLKDLEDNLQTLVDELNQRPDDKNGDVISELHRLEQVLGTQLSSWGVEVQIRVVPPEIRKIFELGTELWVDDGHATVAERKGHGLQRAIVFSLIRAWSEILRTRPSEGTRNRASSDSLVFAFEEPELFLHPQAQRTLAEALKTIADSPKHQVLLSTHSTHFVDLEQYQSIIVVRRPDPVTGTTVRQCTVDLFVGDNTPDRKKRFHMGAWINPDRSELFFAKKVVLVEGETEKAVLPYLAARLGCLDPSVSIIDCGSKHNLSLYIAILNGFSLPYVVIHDEDPVPEPPPSGWSEDKIREKRRTFALNAEIAELVLSQLGTIEVLSPDFEGACGISKSQAEKKGKALAALDHFDSLQHDELPMDLIALIKSVFEAQEQEEKVLVKAHAG